MSAHLSQCLYVRPRVHRSGPQSESSLFDPVLTLSVNYPSQLPVDHLQHVVPLPGVTSAKVFPVKQFLGQLKVVDEDKILRAESDDDPNAIKTRSSCLSPCL